MIVAVVDDLMMRSRISTAARHAGVEVVFVSSVVQARDLAAGGATMVALDLNHPRVRPADLTAHLRPYLAGLNVVGFVSHVDAAAIAEARRSGMTDVLARSAFVAQLPDLIARHRPAPGEDGTAG